MSAQKIEGRMISEALLDQVMQGVLQRQLKGLAVPCLAVVLVGNNAASEIYVRNKKRSCERVGIRSLSYDLPADTTQEALMDLVRELNQNDEVDGILVQLPLPEHLNAEEIIESIDPRKDVDGFHPYNVGRLALKMPLLRPCTPRGVMIMLEHAGIEVKGKHAVIIGASNIVGRPMALELLLARATVTVCHSATQNLQDEVSRADIVVAGVGKPNFVRGAWLKAGAVVIDVGINRLPDGKVVGDVAFDEAVEVASHITPVPGGVGLMTVATLLQNTLDAANARSAAVKVF